jgi:hypothetical protein
MDLTICYDPVRFPIFLGAGAFVKILPIPMLRIFEIITAFQIVWSFLRPKCKQDIKYYLWVEKNTI